MITAKHLGFQMKENVSEKQGHRFLVNFCDSALAIFFFSSAVNTVIKK